MKYKLILIIFALFSISIFAQKNENKLDSLVTAMLSKLIKNGISEFFFLSDNYNMAVDQENVGTGEIISKSVNEFKAYVFTKEGSKFFMQKFDNFKRYSKVIECSKVNLKDFEGFKIIDKYSKKLALEKVKQYEMYVGGKRITIDTPINYLTKFQFFYKSTTFQNQFFKTNIVKSDYNN